jgi:hypothetical protein
MLHRKNTTYKITIKPPHGVCGSLVLYPLLAVPISSVAVETKRQRS